MRRSSLRDFFAAHGARFETRCGVECACAVADASAEHAMVRDAVAVSDASPHQVFVMPEAGAIDTLDRMVAGNVARIRFGRVLHTFMADDSGAIIADCYVANNDDEFLALCESLEDDAAVRARFLAAGGGAGLRDLSESHAVLSIDGCKAWAVARELFGADVLGLPYLSIERYTFEGETVRLIRAGKTSEFGYLLVVPAPRAPLLAARALESAKKHGGGLCGTAVHNDLRLEGRFFNIYAEGAAVRDPLSLGLQWMMDFEKEGYPGGAALLRRRAAGFERKIVGFKAPPGTTIRKGSVLYDDGRPAGEVVAVAQSPILGCAIGLAMLPLAEAYSGLEFALDAPGGPMVTTVSMPPIMPKSLAVKLDEM